MQFTQEPTGCEKTIISDLQGAWILLRETVVESGRFDGIERVLFHIDEAMSWEVVRDLRRMPPLLLMIRNIAHQGDAPDAVIESVAYLDTLLQKVLSEFVSG